MGNDVGSGRFANVAVLIQDEGPRPRRFGGSLLVCQVVMQPAATFQLRRPAVFGDLAHVDHHGLDARDRKSVV